MSVCPRLGVSACLLGQEVRYDGRHKREPFVVDCLGEHVEWVPLCPEVGAGMGIPREPVRLQGTSAEPRMLGWETQQDSTQALLDWSQQTLVRLEQTKLDGYLFKKKSPSCGLSGVELFGEDGAPSEVRVQGLFAHALTRQLPWLPVEEEDGLLVPGRRALFLTRVFALARWRTLMEKGPAPRELLQFHADHKMLLLAFDEATYRKLGPLAAHWKEEGLESTCARYEELLRRGLGREPGVGEHLNAMLHLLGMLKRSISTEERDSLLSELRRYEDGECVLGEVRQRLVALASRPEAPEWVRRQCYLRPYPEVLSL